MRLWFHMCKMHVHAKCSSNHSVGMNLSVRLSSAATDQHLAINCNTYRCTLLSAAFVIA
jgi:hypothetical protein